jgi:hypothetical protein
MLKVNALLNPTTVFFDEPVVALNALLPTAVFELPLKFKKATAHQQLYYRDRFILALSDKSPIAVFTLPVVF